MVLGAGGLVGQLVHEGRSAVGRLALEVVLREHDDRTVVTVDRQGGDLAVLVGLERLRRSGPLVLADERQAVAALDRILVHLVERGEDRLAGGFGVIAEDAVQVGLGLRGAGGEVVVGSLGAVHRLRPALLQLREVGFLVLHTGDLRHLVRRNGAGRCAGREEHSDGGDSKDLNHAVSPSGRAGERKRTGGGRSRRQYV